MCVYIYMYITWHNDINLHSPAAMLTECERSILRSFTKRSIVAFHIYLPWETLWRGWFHVEKKPSQSLKSITPKIQRRSKSFSLATMNISDMARDGYYKSKWLRWHRIFKHPSWLMFLIVARFVDCGFVKPLAGNTHENQESVLVFLTVH